MLHLGMHMVFVRLVLVVVVAMTAALSPAMDNEHIVVPTHDHATVETDAGDEPMCCHMGAEPGLTCHGLPAVLPTSQLQAIIPDATDGLFRSPDALLAGICPSGLLEPPRTV